MFDIVGRAHGSCGSCASPVTALQHVYVMWVQAYRRGDRVNAERARIAFERMLFSQ